MGGFSTLPNAIDPGSAQQPLLAADTKFADEKLEDKVALGLVLQDVNIAENFQTSKARSQEWNRVNNLYRALPSIEKWPGSDKVRSHLSMPLILEVVESLLPQIFLGFFSDKQPFTLTAKGTTTQAAARATEKVLVWALKCSGFKEEIRKILKSALLHGNGIGRWGWKKTTERERVYSAGDDGAITSETHEVIKSVPTFEYCELGSILVDPSVRTHDIRAGRFVIYQTYLTGYDLDELRDDPRYKNIPSRAELKELLAAKSEPTQNSLDSVQTETFRFQQAERRGVETSVDPLAQPLEILEYVSEDRVITVLQRSIVLQNDDNEYDEINYVSCAFVDVLNAFWGLGIGALLEGEQAFESGVVNAWVDSLNLTLSPSFHRKKGVGPGAQNITVAPGKVVNDDGELAPLQVQSVTAEALQAIQSSESRARKRVGANFGDDMPNQAMRTAQGVQQFTAGAQIQVQYFIELFADFVFIPTLEAFVGMAKDNLTPDDIDEILTDEDGEAFEKDKHLDIYKGKYALEVLSSTKLAAKRAMVSLVPVLTQFFASQPVQQGMQVANKKIDWAEFTQQIVDLTGYDTPGLIVDMTPEDQQRAMQLNPAAIKMQSDMAVENMRANNAQQLEQTKGDVRGGLQVVKHLLDTSGKHDDALLAAPQAPLATQAPPNG